MHTKYKIASIIITYDRIDEAKAQMDIIRQLWQPMFESIDIYHEFNGRKDWYPEKYQEDFLHHHRSMPHFSGANYMLNQGIKHILNSNKKYDFIIVSSADTWFYDPKRLREIIDTMSKKRFHLATSLWGFATFGTEFFIIKPELARKVFPLKFAQFINKYKPLGWASKIALFEIIFTINVMRVLKNPNKIYLIPGRRTVWPKNRYCSANFYTSQHDQNKRRKDVSTKLSAILGTRIENTPSLNKFLSP